MLICSLGTTTTRAKKDLLYKCNISDTFYEIGYSKRYENNYSSIYPIKILNC